MWVHVWLVKLHPYKKTHFYILCKLFPNLPKQQNPIFPNSHFHNFHFFTFSQNKINDNDLQTIHMHVTLLLYLQLIAPFSFQYFRYHHFIFHLRLHFFLIPYNNWNDSDCLYKRKSNEDSRQIGRKPSLPCKVVHFALTGVVTGAWGKRNPSGTWGTAFILSHGR